MNLFRKLVCILLSVSLVFALVACGDKNDKDGEKGESKEEVTTSSGEESSVTSSVEEETDDNTSSTVSHREEYVPEAKETLEKFVDNDGKFAYNTVNWAGPNGYVIVVPTGNKAAKETADDLKKFFSEKTGIKLSVVEDSAAKTEKEILIGKTNRTQSVKDLPEGKLEVKVADGKLVFSGGHDVTVDSAVQRFIRLSPQNGKAYTFSVTTDFKSSALNGYKYVWGDEFEKKGVDITKWSFESGMNATETVELSYDKEIVDVEDGRLKMHAIHCFNPYREGTEYRVNYTVGTSDSMNWLYGYLEMRARVPFMKGAWPGYWAVSNVDLSGIRKSSVVAEVDMFEVFGNEDTLYSNLHKHYGGGKHSQFNSTDANNDKSKYKFDNKQNLSNEYHTYDMEWTPTEISMYIDGKKYVTYDITKSYDDISEDMTMFHDPLNIMFNNYVMTQDTDMKTTMIWSSLDKLPTCFYVDYVRLYQKPGVGGLWTAVPEKPYPSTNS